MKIANIKWDTEDNGNVIPPEVLGLPAEVFVEDIDEEDVVDYLSDKYGYCIYSADIEEGF